ncbi:MAG: hypothetical protein HUJ51_04460, partial [Eggerthellaceae bacterium]|nr:hypothetical protein [Eggerthellaceae bacterium]
DEKDAIFTVTYINDLSEDEKNVYAEQKYNSLPSNLQIIKDRYESLFVWSNESSDTYNPFDLGTNDSVFISEELQRDACFPGTAVMNLKEKFNGTKGFIFTRIVDYGECHESEAVDASMSVLLGNSVDYPQKNFMRKSTTSNYHIVFTGSVNIHNVNSKGKSWMDSEVSNYSAPYIFELYSIESNVFYNYRLELLCTNHTFKKGYRAGVIILGVDEITCNLPSVSPNYKFDLSVSTIDMPRV